MKREPRFIEHAGQALLKLTRNAAEIQTSLNVSNCYPAAGSCLRSVFQHLAGFTWSLHRPTPQAPLYIHYTLHARVCSGQPRGTTCLSRTFVFRDTDGGG